MTDDDIYYVYESPAPSSSSGTFTFRIAVNGVITIRSSSGTTVFTNEVAVNAIAVKVKPFYLILANDGSLIEYDSTGKEIYIFVDKMEGLNNILAANFLEKTDSWGYKDLERYKQIVFRNRNNIPYYHHSYTDKVFFSSYRRSDTSTLKSISFFLS